MKVLIFLVTISCAITVFSQSPNSIKQQCPLPNRSIYSTVKLTAAGNINYDPCPTKSSIFTGIVDFSGATVTGIFSGTGTLNHIPRFSGIHSVSDTPFTWNDTIYSWNNNAANAQFRMDLTPSAASAGIFAAGYVNSTRLLITEVTQTIDFNRFGISHINARFDNINRTFTLNAGDGTTGQFLFDGGNQLITLGAGSAVIQIDNPTNKISFGDVNNVGNQLRLDIDNNAPEVDLFGGGLFVLDGNVTSRQGFYPTQVGLADIGTPAIPFVNVVIGHAANQSATITGTYTGNVTTTIPDKTGTVLLNTLVNLDRTLPAGTGSQVINTTAGILNFAAASTDLTVTNSLALTTSLIFCTVQTNDATALGCRVTDRAAGSFHVRLSPAPTATTTVAFFVTN